MKIAKAAVASVGVVCTFLTAALADNVFGLDEVGKLVAIAIEQGLTVYAVWRVPNRS